MIDVIKMIFLGIMCGIYYHYSWRFLYEKGIIDSYLNFKPFSCDECYSLWLSIILTAIVLVSPADTAVAIISIPTSMVTSKLFSMNYWGNDK